jgi:hypothetical protein
MVAPVVLNTFQMPLVHNSYNLLAFTVIDMSEEILITLINKDLLSSWEEDVSRLNVPVDHVLIKAFFREGFGTYHSNLLSVHLIF